MELGNTSIDNAVYEEALKLQTAFLKTISHEIRTPLNVIVGCCDVLSLPDCDTETREMLVLQLKRSVRYLLNFCDNAAFINSLEAGSVVPHPNKFDAMFALEFIYNSAKSLIVAANKRDSVRYMLQNYLGGEGSSPVHIYGDDSLMCRAIALLVENAIKFTESGSVTLEAGFATATDGSDMLKIQVIDTGIGIAEEYHGDIFKKFWKAPQTGSKIYDGAGLGLAIVKNIVDLLNGNITVESAPGNGSVFTVMFPITR